MSASASRTRYYLSMLQLFEKFDVLAIPVAQVWPFDATLHWPKEVAGRPMDTYHRWMEVVIYATFAGLPSISVPAGFGAGNMPVGLQLIGNYFKGAQLLNAAHRLQQATDFHLRKPGTLA